MQALERAAATFCIACICAEVLSRLVGQGWGQKCIKAVAGLYILVVFVGLLPGIKAQLSFSGALQSEPVPVGNMKDAVLMQAEKDLAAALEERCIQETGVSLTLEIELEQTEEGVKAEKVYVLLPEKVDAAKKHSLADLLTGQLQLTPEQLVWETPGGEDGA